jgi:aquaporin Z
VQAQAQQAQAQGRHAQERQEQAWGTEPIVQDGWQWDPHTQQWVPLAQPEQPQQQQWPPAEGGDQTQIRPPGQ